MRNNTASSRPLSFKSALLAVLGVLFACGEEDNSLAPYAGGPRELSNFVVEANSFVPKMAWTGGYVSALGVNRGARAALDSSLVWLIHSAGNNIQFPLAFGQVPAGAQDLTGQYGGQRSDRVSEDETYSYWVLKEDVWSQVVANPNKPLQVDPNLAAAAVDVRQDTVFISSFSHTQLTQHIDVYVNIQDLKTFGRLGLISVQQPTTSNNPVVTWTIAQAGVTDTSISVMGLIHAQQYQETGKVWEVWSEEVVAGQTLYGQKNVIAQPVIMGQAFPETRIFVEYPQQGVERNKDYYIWIANENWDRQGRTRATLYYAYATFRTW